MILDRIIKETTDITRVIMDLDDFLDPSEVITEIVSASVSLGIPGWSNTPYPPMAQPPPYDPTPLILDTVTLDAFNRTLIAFVSFGTPGNSYSCTFVLAGTSAQHFTCELMVQVSGNPPVHSFVPMPVKPPGSLALPLAGGTMEGPLYLYEDPLYPTEAATKAYVDHVAGAFGGPFLSLSGGVMTGVLTLAHDPVLPMQAATQRYVDATDNALAAQFGNYLTRSNVALPSADPHVLGELWMDPAAGYAVKVSQG